MIPKIDLPNGAQIPCLGQGTWHMGENPAAAPKELEALQAGIAQGMTLIDTAEMYADGKAECLVGKLLEQVQRDTLYLVSKVYPFHAGEEHIFRACEDSLRRMGVETLDLYLLHWRGNVPLLETIHCMQALISQGKIRAWGVSNFDLSDMKELFLLSGGKECAVNQVLYHLASRGIEYDLLPWMKKRRVPVMAYCPLAQAGRLRKNLLHSHVLLEIAQTHQATVAQILLAFVLLQKNIVAIPKAGDPKHAVENAAAHEIRLTKEDLARLNMVFPAPQHKVPLDIV